ncbi:nucleotidyl transferase AbiEii/AbiGii toxin family protein [Bradyrhizobium cytisi]|uniref:Nucleotidyl transferase AbiEii/AbiGii toxin family protein n=1 Tax=Bradyrhizobium cytisi TaxID=515489 RepID=A0A5S4VY85_9BRAD|nr:nucleotidyl transferase AbiEii/AbiGii toxin family protein [Bradyrhizobium cytisi]TYL70148.1 nucleotidyl transferase AbiEii/AbiGii toxin family protein [Bradyrhizobium cytisi]
MALANVYKKQVALLLRVLPFVTEEKCFALKGGTTINLFVRDMPRLSVDIDLTYVPVAPRPESLADIDAAVQHIAAKVKDKIPGALVHETRKEGAIVKLVVRAQNVQIKIEVTPVLRGCVYEPVVIFSYPHLRNLELGDNPLPDEVRANLAGAEASPHLEQLRQC